MEPQTASVYSSSSVPRLRVTRRPSSTASGARPSVQWPTDLKRSLSYPDSQTTSEDETGTIDGAESNPRLLSASLLPPDSTAESSHRLRAILDRFDNPSRTLVSASRHEMPPSPSEPESDFDVPPAQAARASIKVLLQNALREPGDTPEKPKPTRRASFNAAGSPKIKSRRKSTSDEEIETFARRHDERPSDMSTAASLDRLRLQLTESMPSIQASSSGSTSHPPSEANVSTLKRVSPSHHARASKIPVSNSPMRHAKSHQDLESFATASSDVGISIQQGNPDLNHPRAQTLQSHSHSSHDNTLNPVTRHHSHDAVLQESSRRSSTQPDADHRERVRKFQHEVDEHEQDRNRHNPPPLARSRASSGQLHSSTDRNTGRLSPGAWPTPPAPGTIANNIRSPRHSLTKRETSGADAQSEDGISSRGTSVSSIAEYRERLKETEREHQRDLEHNWNRPHPQHSQSVLHLRGYAQRPEPSAEHEHTHSRVGHDFAGTASPSSSTSSHSHLEEDVEEQTEVAHERERNWNSPRPKWGQHPHHGSEVDHYNFPRAPSPLPPHTPDDGQGHSTTHGRHRTSSLGSIDRHPHSRPHSSLLHDPPRPHSRLENRYDHPRTGSPSSSTSSRSHHEDDVEELHERERNWNAPKPKWDQHNQHPHHHQTSGYKADHHLSRTVSSHSLGHSAPVNMQQTVSEGRPHSSSSLGIISNGKSAQSVSPTPLLRTQSLGTHSGHSASSVRSMGAHHPRPNSTLSRSIENGNVKDKEPEILREKGWNLPKVSPSHRHESTPSSPSPIPSRSKSRASNAASLTNFNTSSDVPTRRSTSPGPSSMPEPVSASDVKKGHRRTTTELSEAMGPFPRQSAKPPSLAIPADESDGSLFADESVPPPRMSTPTFKKNHLIDLSLSPAASDIPLPPSPEATTHDPSSRADSDFARLQRAVAPDFTFPARQPSPPEASALSTPPRRSSFNTKRIEFRTPSPPLGLPDLPGPPSSDEEEARTPIRGNEPVDHPSLSAMKTPRFPGAFGTPAPPPSAPDIGSSTEEVSDEVETTPKLETVVTATQPQVLGNYDVTSTPGPISAAVTPAPPGAYRPTPTPSKRKGILKVRFDGDVPNSGTVDGTGEAANGVVSAIKVTSLPPSPSSEDIPPLSLSPSRRKGLRLVDEYGRARRFTEDGEEIILDVRRKGTAAPESPGRTSPPKPSLVDDMTLTPRRRAKMRQVDALGNEITEKQKQPNGEVHEKRASRKAVFSRLTRSLGELRDNLAEEEEALTASMPLGGPRADERLMDLAGVSKTARVERNKLARKLQLERNAEGGITDKVYVARNPAVQPPLETATRVSWWRRKWRLALCLLILELVVLCVGYRLASIHAKQAWLATHYDPFFPALYLRKSPPGFISRFGTLPVGWSAFAISGAVRRVGVWGFVEGVGKHVWEGIWTWRMEPWEIWGSPAAGPPVPQAWPPS